MMREANDVLSLPVLMRINYANWALLMHVNLQAQGTWEAIDPRTAEYHVDQLALAAILYTIPSEML